MGKNTLETLFEDASNSECKKTKKTSLKEQLAKAEALAKEYENKYRYLLADLDNVRKQATKRVGESAKLANEKMMKDLLPILDDFSRAKEHGELSEGVEHIYDKFSSILISKGLEKVEPIGKEFDINLHEAIAEVPSSSEESGFVIDCIEDGYKLNGNVIRYAKVAVGKG